MAQFGLIIPGFIILMIDPSLSGGLPKIYYLLGAFGFFFHQTLDSLDGKQARRIQASSPLGHLLDHGSDAYTLYFYTVILCSSDGMGNQEYILWGITQLMTIGDFLGNWVEYQSKVFVTNTDQFGFFDCQLIMMFILTFNYVTGIGLAEIPIFKGLTVIHFIVITLFCIAPFLFYYGWKFVAPQITDAKKALLKFVPMITLLVCSIILSSIEEFDSFKGWVVIGYAAYVSVIQCKLIVCRLSNLEYQVLHFEVVYLLILSVLAKLCSDPTMKRLIFLLIIVGGHFFLIDFTIDVVSRIANKLKINVFTVTPKEANQEKVKF